MNYVDPKLQARRTQIVEVLEMVCEIPGALSLSIRPGKAAL